MGKHGLSGWNECTRRSAFRIAGWLSVANNCDVSHRRCARVTVSEG
jgi:hypothetical protein